MSFTTKMAAPADQKFVNTTAAEWSEEQIKIIRSEDQGLGLPHRSQFSDDLMVIHALSCMRNVWHRVVTVGVKYGCIV